MKQHKIEYISIIILVIFIISFAYSLFRIKNFNEVFYKNNINALTDSIEIYKLKNGELLYEKTALVTTNKHIKEENEILYKEIKNIKDKLLTAEYYQGTIIHDTIYTNIYLSDSTISGNIKEYIYNWSYDTIYDTSNYYKINGICAIDLNKNNNVLLKNVIINKNEIGVSFVTGIKEDKKSKFPEIYFKTNYPNFTITQMNGAVFDPRESATIKKFFPPKRWGISIYAGYGLYYDINKSTLGYGFNAGIGMSYDIFQWSSKKISK